MTKHGFLTPKAISNRIKAKGLQKLRWYCQMCQKQCRDENGMRCHMKSEGHLRAMRVFGENPQHIVDDYSREFLRGFLDTLSHRYIGDKHHVHMNSTCWSSLSGLCKFLGKEGKAVVDETEKGWFIQYIDRDPKMIARQAAAEQRQKSELGDEERMQRMIDAQIAAAELRKRQLEGDEDMDEEDGVYDDDEEEEEGEGEEEGGNSDNSGQESQSRNRKKEKPPPAPISFSLSMSSTSTASDKKKSGRKLVSFEDIIASSVTSSSTARSEAAVATHQKAEEGAGPKDTEDDMTTTMTMSMDMDTGNGNSTLSTTAKEKEKQRGALPPSAMVSAELFRDTLTQEMTQSLNSSTVSKPWHPPFPTATTTATANSTTHSSHCPTGVASSAEPPSTVQKTKPGKLSALESLKIEEENRRAYQLSQEDKKERKDYWLAPGIIVKVVSEKVGKGKYYKKKGEVLRVVDKYVGELRVEDAILRIDQEELETVIPKVGASVLVVNGRARGCRATLLKIHEKDFCCDVRVEEGTWTGRQLTSVVYEDVSKLAGE